MLAHEELKLLAILKIQSFIRYINSRKIIQNYENAQNTPFTKHVSILLDSTQQILGNSKKGKIVTLFKI
jgi:hypothetical protein